MRILTNRQPFHFKEFFLKSLIVSAFCSMVVFVKPLAFEDLYFSEMCDEYLAHFTSALSLFMWVWFAFKNSEHGLQYRGKWISVVKKKYLPFSLAGILVGMFVQNYVFELANGMLLASTLLLIYGGQYRKERNLDTYKLPEWSLAELVLCAEDMTNDVKCRNPVLLKYIRDEIEARNGGGIQRANNYQRCR